MTSVSDAVGALFDVTSDAVVVVGPGGHIRAWNPRAEQLFGVAAREAVTGSPTPLHPHLPTLLALPAEAPPVAVPLPPHGSVEVVRRAIGGRDVLLLRDTSTTRRQRDALHRRAALTRELLGKARSLPTTLQHLATEAKHLTGADYSALMLLREGTTEATHFAYDAPRHLFPASTPRFVGLLSIPLQTRGATRLDEMAHHPAALGLPDGHAPIGPLLSVPVLAAEAVLGELSVGNASQGRCFDELDEALLVDLAAHVAVAVRWTQAAEAADEQARRRAELVDVARHDVRTPLGAGKGFASLLSSRLDRMSPAQVATALDGLHSSFERIEAFTAQLLADDVPPAGPPAPAWAGVDLVALLHDVRAAAARATGRPDAVQVLHAPAAPSSLVGDPEQVRAVIDHLVDGALERADGRPVVVTVRAEAQQVRLDVRDEGAAAPPELSWVRRTVQAHGGTLGVSARPGDGATLWVTFPVPVPAPSSAT